MFGRPGRPITGGADGAEEDVDLGFTDGAATADWRGVGRLLRGAPTSDGATDPGVIGGRPATAATTIKAIATVAETTAASDRSCTGKPVKSSPLADRFLAG